MLGTGTEPREIPAFRAGGPAAPGANYQIDPPKNLMAIVAGQTAIDLTWEPPDDDSNLCEYDVEFSRNAGQNWRAAGASHEYYRHSGLQPGETWHYRVLSIDCDDEESEWTEVIQATTRSQGGTVPSQTWPLRANHHESSAIDLSWGAPIDAGSSAITGYRIEVSADGGATWADLESNTGTDDRTYRHGGLQPRTTRHYRVSAINDAGIGFVSNVANATTLGEAARVPGAPTDLTATVDGDSAIDLAWVPPTDSGNSRIQGYVVERSADGQNFRVLRSLGARATTYRHSRRQPGVTQYYRVYARNAAGNGPPSNVASATTGSARVPGAPTGLGASADGLTAIALTWTAPADSGSTPIFGYRIEESPDAGTSWSDLESNTGSTDTSFRHTGLQPGTTRHYRVSAINDAGPGPPSGVASATTGNEQLPGVPRGLTAMAEGDSVIVLSWSPPADAGSSAITGYRIEASNDGSQWSDLRRNTRSTATTFRESGLQAGRVRYYRVSAINGQGTGAPTPAVRANTTARPPGRPTGLTASAEGATRINLSWSAPRESGGADIVGYRIEVSADGGASWMTLEGNTNSTVTTYTHSGLAPDATRHYRVSAVNSTGTGPPSNVVSATTGATSASAPSNLAGRVIGTSRIDLSWTAPADDGGDPVTAYRIQAHPAGEPGWSVLVDNTGSAATVYSHTGLSPASDLRYRVQAINAGGVGPVSNVARAATDAAFPGAPTQLSAVAAGPTRISLSWSAPSSTGGVPIMGYQIEVHRTGKVPWTILVADTRSTGTQFNHGDLEPGSTWRYRVAAINSAGTGEASKAVRATTDALRPDPPTRLKATANGSERIDLKWTTPDYDGGAPISGYRIENRRQNSSTWALVVANSGSSATEYAHTGLEPGSDLVYRVSAINTAGRGDPSNTARATTDAVGPGPPRQLRALVPGPWAIQLLWNAPSYNGGAPITGYRIEVSDDGGLAWEELVGDTRSTARQYVHEGLRPATTRHYRVFAVNRSGPGAPSDVAEATTDAYVPDTPRQLVASARDHAEIDLGWDAPAFDGGAPIAGYRIEVSEDAGASWTALEVNTRSTNTFHVHRGLLPASTRHYRVFAINEEGVSDPSNVASATTDAVAPGPPTQLVATATAPSRIELTWKAPAYDGGAPVTGYRVEVSADAGSWNDLESSTHSTNTAYAHTELGPGSTRHYRVSAINVAGPGEPSGIASATTDDPVQRAGRLNAAVLPHFVAATSAATLEAIAGRVEAVALGRSPSRELRARGLMALAGSAGARDRDEGPTVARVLDGASFAMPFVDGTAGQETAPSGGTMGLWGAAEHQGMGEPRADDVRWEGGMLSLHVGADRRIRRDFLVGVAGGRSAGEYDFADLTGAREVEGIYEARMTTVSPYAAWLPGGPGVAVWVAGSFGWGRVEIDDHPAGMRASGMRMLAGALGGRRVLLSNTASSLGLHSEGWYSRVSLDGTEEMEAVTLEMQRARFLLEGAHVYRYPAGHQVRLMLESGLRYDVGDATNGVGLEAGGGLRYRSASGRVAAEGRGRVRLTGSDGYEEWGVAGRFEIAPRRDGRGLSFRLAPSWGEAASGVRELWQRGLGDPAGEGMTTPKALLNAEAAYGLSRIPGAPYGILQLAPGRGRALGAGIRYQVAQLLNLRLEGNYSKTHATVARPQLAIGGSWRF